MIEWVRMIAAVPLYVLSGVFLEAGDWVSGTKTKISLREGKE